MRTSSAFRAARVWAAAAACGAGTLAAAQAPVMKMKLPDPAPTPVGLGAPVVRMPVAPVPVPAPVVMPAVSAPPAAAPAPVPVTAPPLAAPAVGCPTGGCDTAVAPGCQACSTGHGKHGHGGDGKAAFANAANCRRMPAPIVPAIGTYMRDAFALQRDNALAEYFVLFREEFVGGTGELNASGQRHLDGVIRRLGGNSHAVKVEPSGYPAVDEMRRAAVASALIKGGLDPAAAAARVTLGGTRAEGMRYDEIPFAYGRSTWGGGGGQQGYGTGNFGSGTGGFGGFGYGR